MGNAGNEKQAGQKKGAGWLPPHDAPDGKAWRCPDCTSWATLRENAHAHQIATGHGRPAIGDQPPPPSAEKPLLGEPTARTLIEALLPAASANGHFTPHEAVAAARAYLATRAQPEEALIEAALNCATAVRTASPSAAAFKALYARAMALALPVEGRAPDASHEKKLGKKGAKP
jgi:hypothetical protein